MNIDLPDLSEWGFVDTLTIDEACLLWGAINPLDYDHPQGDLFLLLKADMPSTDIRLRKALMARRLLIDGVCEGTLSTTEAWEIQLGDFDQPYRVKLEAKVLPTRGYVVTGQTRVKNAVLVKWLKDKGLLTIRQEVQLNERKIGALAKAGPILLEKPGLYKPKHENPAFETLQEFMQEFWDEVEEGVKPPKSGVTIDLIREKYVEKFGVEPSKNVITQIDAIARPPIFKGQEKKK